METINTRLINQQWVLHELGTPVKEKLADALKIDRPLANTSFTYLASDFYKRRDVSSALGPDKKGFLNPVTADNENLLCLNSHVHSLLHGGQLISSRNLPEQCLKDAEELGMFFKSSPLYNELYDFLENAFYLENTNFRGASHPHFLGSLFLRATDNYNKLEFLISIVHETAHQELFLINFIDRLVNSEYDYNMLHAPFQGRIRPPIGRLHSLHAVYRMIQFLELYDPKASKRDELIGIFRESVGRFSPGELTPFATFLRENVYEKFLS